MTHDDQLPPTSPEPAEPSRTALLELDHVSLALPTETGMVGILDDVSFRIHPGEMVGLAGESGSGKTMTALSIMRLLPERHQLDGRILFEGHDLATMTASNIRSLRGRDIAMIFQEPMSSLHPSWTVGEQIAESVRAHEHVGRKAAWARAVEMLRLVDIPNPELRAKQYPFQFSGGMQQRVMIAMALVCRPKLLIADEPTTALDVTVQAQIIELIRGLGDEFGMAVLFVTHDLGVLAGLTERLIIMYGGQVAEIAATEDMFDRPKHPYTEALIRTAPHPDLKGHRLETIPGSPPHPGRLPTGCRFQPRCQYQDEICRTEAVPIERVGDRQAVRCHHHDELELRATVERSER
ncbi:MAG: ABC transporter ATP-binding protein [Ilumatobacteraceae bacterium]|nr:ABC transporter ATP-binding protein [Ilumatobacteraceae bacterium]